ncbi:alternate-type signal peptide domain-containing protein [Rhodococcus sp. W8901]|uniref:alternate-type signal peptide domain-containing protein n=1 Tax=Rhodococcus sp. W8901 TaxID=2742603 RepID=UPI001582107D|nr:alternate-type signal peptide domain-containing protein [Rhodococcus sp. W8901]QKT10298.1 alternate-type signal peptide domain-containing protein [Rhodococcus sp. W8901]
MKTQTKGFRVAVAAATLGSTLMLSACDFGSLGSGSAGGATTTTPSAPTTTAPPTTIGGGGNGSGSLALTQVTTPGWSDRNGPIDIATFRVVPGDVLTYRGSYRLTVNGTGLQARLTADDIAFTGGGQLKGKLQPQVTATIGGTVVPSGPAGIVVDTAQNNAVVDVAARFIFDPQTSGIVGQSDSATFGDFRIRLEQVLS